MSQTVRHDMGLAAKKTTIFGRVDREDSGIFQDREFALPGVAKYYSPGRFHNEYVSAAELTKMLKAIEEVRN